MLFDRCLLFIRLSLCHIFISIDLYRIAFKWLEHFSFDVQLRVIFFLLQENQIRYLGCIYKEWQQKKTNDSFAEWFYLWKWIFQANTMCVGWKKEERERTTTKWVDGTEIQISTLKNAIQSVQKICFSRFGATRIPNNMCNLKLQWAGMSNRTNIKFYYYIFWC